MKIETLEDILQHQKAANHRLYLVASENSPSITARAALISDVLNRYYFPLDQYRHWAFPGNEFLESIYKRCESLLREVTGAKYIVLRPISGANAMTLALASLTEAGDTIASLSPENGGHGITSFIARRLGLRTLHVPYDQKNYLVDCGALSDLVHTHNIHFIYLDQAHILFPINITNMKEVLPDETKIYYDGSHVMGLIFGSHFQSPLLEGASFLGGSTHKTVPGPHKAFIATNSESAYERIKLYGKVFISHDHVGEVAALAITLEEMRTKWDEYAERVVSNAQYFAELLSKKGFSIVANEHGFTSSHQLWIDIHPFMDAFEAVMLLASCNIITNTINAPSLSGRLAIRIGVQEITYCGANRDTMEMLAGVFEKIFIKKTYSEESVKKTISEIKKGLTPPLDKEYFERVYDALNNY